jgi:hypothetical protein
LENPESALVCDCGYKFVAQAGTTGAIEVNGQQKSVQDQELQGTKSKKPLRAIIILLFIAVFLDLCALALVFSNVGMPGTYHIDSSGMVWKTAIVGWLLSLGVGILLGLYVNIRRGGLTKTIFQIINIVLSVVLAAWSIERLLSLSPAFRRMYGFDAFLIALLVMVLITAGSFLMTIGSMRKKIK